MKDRIFWILLVSVSLSGGTWRWRKDHYAASI